MKNTKPSLKNFIKEASRKSTFESSESRDTFASQVGERLREKRESIQNLTGLKQSDIANELGILKTTLCHYEAGRRIPSLIHFKRMCERYSADPIDILDIDKNKYIGGKTIHSFIAKDIPIEQKNDDSTTSEIDPIPT